MLESIRTLDTWLLLAVNRAQNPFLDEVMVFVSERTSWIPAYVLLIGFLIYEFRRRALLLLPLVITGVGLADIITSRLFKPFFARLRPCHDAEVSGLLHLPNGCGGQFGFLSSHAANSFALAVFLAVALAPERFRALKITAFLWAILMSYSRVYLGAHYPGDVLGGAALGGLLGWAAAATYRHLAARRAPPSTSGR